MESFERWEPASKIDVMILSARIAQRFFSCLLFDTIAISLLQLGKRPNPKAIHDKATKHVNNDDSF